MDEAKVVNDLDNYYKMSEPFESTDAANKAISTFYEELSLLRKKHKITDLLVVIKGSVKYSDGRLGEFIQHSNFGSSLNVGVMAAYAYGQAQADHEEKLNKLLAGNKKF